MFLKKWEDLILMAGRSKALPNNHDARETNFSASLRPFGSHNCHYPTSFAIATDNQIKQQIIDTGGK